MALTDNSLNSLSFKSYNGLKIQVGFIDDKT